MFPKEHVARSTLPAPDDPGLKSVEELKAIAPATHVDLPGAINELA